MTERVSLAALGVLALCVAASAWFANMSTVNHDATEIVKLIVAGLVGFMTGSGADAVLQSMRDKGSPPSLPEPIEGVCPTCGRSHAPRELPHPEFGNGDGELP